MNADSDPSGARSEPSATPGAARGAGIGFAMGLAGCLIGGAVGVLATHLLAQSGIGLPALPGALVGFVCGLMSRMRSELLGVICGVLGLAVGYGCLGWLAGRPVLEYLMQVGDLSGSIHLPVGIGAALAWWMGRGRARR